MQKQQAESLHSGHSLLQFPFWNSKSSFVTFWLRILTIAVLSAGLPPLSATTSYDVNRSPRYEPKPELWLLKYSPNINLTGACLCQPTQSWTASIGSNSKNSHHE
eukprot:GHVN01100091.1.p1 GENE.GHVN01100091.1~~GHVN01100091.1.p1  ORF type:complete len:105 (+),score=6.17 GHVN01100091.1:616-930(+)